MARPLNANNLSGWQIQRNVISALVYRELKTRVSQVRFGVFGVFIEPLGVMAVFLIIFSFLRGKGGDEGLSTPLFLTAGIVLFTLFNDVGVRCVNAMTANEALFFYKPVKPIDTVISRALVESALYGIVLIVITAGIFIIQEAWTLDNFYLLTFSFVCIALTAMGLGLALMVAGHRYPSLPQFVPLAMRPLWFISGVFFSLDTIPYWLRPWLSWNPVLQSIELARHAFSEDYPLSELVSAPYLFAVAICTTTLGLWVYINNERILLTR